MRANLIAERVAIESYRQMIAAIGDKDPTTRQMLVEIMAVEEEHADDMRDLLARSTEHSLTHRFTHQNGSIMQAQEPITRSNGQRRQPATCNGQTSRRWSRMPSRC